MTRPNRRTPRALPTGSSASYALASLVMALAAWLPPSSARADGGSASRPLSPGLAPPELTLAATLATPSGLARALVLSLAPDLGKPVLVLEQLAVQPDGRLALVNQRPLERLKLGPHELAATELEALSDLLGAGDHFVFKVRSPRGQWRCTLTPSAPSSPLTATCQGRYAAAPATPAPTVARALVAACDRASTDPGACLRAAQALPMPAAQLAPIVVACDRATARDDGLIACLQALRGPDADGRDPGILIDLIDVCRGATSTEAETLACLRRSLSW